MKGLKICGSHGSLYKVFLWVGCKNDIFKRI